MDPSLRQRLDDGILAFALGDPEGALPLVEGVTREAPGSLEAWLALAEIHHASRRYPEALAAAERAAALDPEDVHVQTSLSRVWMELGDKAKAEHHGARARMLSWKQELREPPPGVRP